MVLVITRPYVFVPYKTPAGDQTSNPKKKGERPKQVTIVRYIRNALSKDPIIESLQDVIYIFARLQR
jgi:hypothetical protein